MCVGGGGLLVLVLQTRRSMGLSMVLAYMCVADFKTAWLQLDDVWYCLWSWLRGYGTVYDPGWEVMELSMVLAKRLWSCLWSWLGGYGAVYGHS